MRLNQILAKYLVSITLVSLYLAIVTMTMALSVPISFTSTCRFILSQVVIDKETKMKESLRILSLKSGAYGLSYFITQSIFTIVTALLMTATFAIEEYIRPEMFA